MKRHVFWIVELFIWLLILFLVAGGMMLAKYNYRKNFNTYQIFLPDVDGLINGSPVKIMGIQIGYVNQVDIVGEDVYVKFIVTEKNVRLPKGAVATVEFSGLGGSKSLEIYPPKKGQKIPSDKLLVAQNPKRIHDSLGLLNEMLGKVTNIAYRVSYFMGKVGIIQNQESIEEEKSVKAGTQLLELSDGIIDRAQKQCDNFSKKIEKSDFSKNDRIDEILKKQSNCPKEKQSQEIINKTPCDKKK